MESPLEPHVDAGGREPLPDPDVEVVEQLIHLVPALWRTMKRAAVSGQHLPANESQVTVLRLLMHHERLTTSQLAEIMHLARPTVSNLIKGLAARGLVERSVSALDGRVITVIATPAGRDLLLRFRSDRAEIVRLGVARLDADDQREIEGATPALRRLLRELEQLADEFDHPVVVNETEEVE